jgi:long-chain fatty acid transport protein
VRIKGDDIAYGYNLGVLVDVTERLAWGLSYRSKVDYELEGSIKVSDFNAIFNGDFKGTLDITMPESVDTSVTYKANDKWTLYAGSTWTRWSRLKKIEAIHRGNLPTREDLNWQNTWSHAIGVAYQVTPAVVLRSGFALDASPTTNEHRTVRIPVSNRKIYSLGLGWNIDQDWTVDVAYAYVDESKGRVSQTNKVTNLPYTAQYDNSAHGLGIQLTHRF